MKKASLSILIIVSLLLASCASPQEIDSYATKTEKITLLKKFRDPAITSLSVYVRQSRIYSVEGEFYSGRQLYDFYQMDGAMNYTKLYDIVQDDSYFPSLEFINDVLEDVRVYMDEKFNLKDYKLRLFSNSFSMTLYNDRTVVLRYDNGKFWPLDGISMVNSMCLLIYGGDVSLLVILD